jgi:glucose/arabinose dehydrogenase
MRKAMTATLITLFVLGALPPASFAAPKGGKVVRYKGGLNFPVDMGWVPGTKRTFFTEKTGRIRVMQGRKLIKRPCARLDVASDGERGLLGLALHPNYRKNHFLYVFYVNASPLESRVARFKVKGNRCRSRKGIVANVPAPSGYHIGGQLEFAGGKPAASAKCCATTPTVRSRAVIPFRNQGIEAPYGATDTATASD